MVILNVYYINMQKNSATKQLQAALVIDGAYLMIGAKDYAKNMLPFFQSPEGITEFVSRISLGLVRLIKNVPSDKLSIGLASKLIDAPTIDGCDFSSKHLLYALAESGSGQKYSPDGIIRNVWKDFSLRENLHKYKEHGLKCDNCGSITRKKVQAGVDVGVAVRICEIIIESLIPGAESTKKKDTIVLIAGDRDFKDVMTLCEKYFPNLYLLGFKENTNENIQEHCAGFFDLRDILQLKENPFVLKEIPILNKSVTVGVNGIVNTIDQKNFCELLQSNGISIAKVKWQIDKFNSRNSFAFLMFSSQEEADKAIKFVCKDNNTLNRLMLLLAGNVEQKL